MKKSKIILASKSPRRALLLEQIGASFSICKNSYVEKVKKDKSTEKDVITLVIENAKRKAVECAKNISKGVILGVDTLVFYNGELIGKPKNSDDALRILSLLNGTKHVVFSGIALLKKEKNNSTVLSDFEKTFVFMRRATKKELEEYVATGEPLDKAGGYGIQEKGAIFMEKVEGDFSNVVGLPIPKLLKLCNTLRIKIV